MAFQPSNDQMGEWFAGRMWSEHPALNDFGNWAAPLALGVAFEATNWGFARATPQAGMDRAFGPRHSERFELGTRSLELFWCLEL